MDSVSIVSPVLGNTMGNADSSFVVAEWQDAGAPPEGRRFIAPVHVHYRDDEAWYVVEGALGVRVGERELEAHAGDGVFVPRGAPHTYWNASSQRLRYLLVMTPRTHQLIQELHSTPNRTFAMTQAIFKKYDSELLNS